MKRLSIIVPIYNVGPYVERCLRSLEEQDIPNMDYEIICINDGSPDNSREVVIKLQKEFKNIILIDQENQGVSRARNNGIEIACGKYLLFIDPDDYVQPTCFSRILKTSDDQNAQVSFLGYTFLNEDGTVRSVINFEMQRGKVFLGIDAYKLFRGDGKTDPDRMVAVLYEREFLNRNKLRYLPDVPYLEDGELIARILCLADVCIFEGNSFYQRTTRPGSATNSRLYYTEKATKGFLKAASQLKSFQLTSGLNAKQQEFLNQPICKFILLTLMSTMDDKNNFVRIIDELKSLGLNKCITKGCNNFYRIEGTLYNLFPYLLLLHRKIGAPLLKIVKP
jgi:glycosyltransferase involved in cell wall biosynthesis